MKKDSKYIQVGIRINKKEKEMLDKAAISLSKRVAGVEVSRSAVLRQALIEFCAKEVKP